MAESMRRTEVSVVIPSWNGAQLVAKTLERLVRSEGVNFEVLVIDHGRLNRDTEKALVGFAAYPWVRYVGCDEQLGYAGAVNRGTELAASDTVVVICNDVLVAPDWLKELVAAHRRARAEGENPVLFSLVNREILGDVRRARANIWLRILEPPGSEPEERFPFPDGSAFLFDRQFYGHPFDGEYFLYQEDAYLGWRAWLSGDGVRMAPTSRADNFDGGTTRRTPYLTSYLTERNRWLNYLIFLSVASLIRLGPLLFLDAFVKLAFGTNRRAKLQAWCWIVMHPRKILAKRRVRQKERRHGDERILALFSATYIQAAPGHPVNIFFRVLAKICGLPLGP
jgi:GT2 family glycosyltransferase